MKNFSVIILLILLLFSFETNYGQTERLIPDEYSITSTMLKNNHSAIKIGDVESFDKAWFKNDSLKQILVIELATDYHQYEIFHFYNNDIPSELIEQMEFNVTSRQPNTYDTASAKKKQQVFTAFFKFSKQIDQKYFKTKKGFILGSKKEKALKVYGKPDTCFASNDLEICEWRYEGDYSDDETPLAVSKKPLAKNSFGYNVTMYFRKEKLIAMILFNDIP